MNRSNRILPVYTGDVSGACSALFELGGMVVIHDPSGCNSTYNTHDETRWYDHDSLIFITGLTERDAILGNDDKLIRDVVDTARELRPHFIALCNSPIPWINGTDFAAISHLIERQTDIPCFHVKTNGMHDYVVGAGNALAEIARRFVVNKPQVKDTVNILGVTPLDYHQTEASGELKRFCDEQGLTVTSCWAMGSTLDDLARAAEASVNLVVSAAGLAAAKVLRERFGTPYVVGTPYAGGADLSAFRSTLAQALRNASSSGQCAYPCRDARPQDVTGTCFIVCDPVVGGSLAAAQSLSGMAATRVVCPTEAAPELLAPCDIAADGEEEAEAALASATSVTADRFYEAVLPEGATLTPLPHLAFSGRNAL
ncbi:MAG: hypothetical protein IJ092_04660 [Atopobiaceae bacterium]|nr:hypothetical protein [Atopobiaceae bacterium]MBR1830166.1 hypothetical protein [Atopobiaceae bacterium]